MDNEILWTAGFLNERFTEPVSPLGWSFVGTLFEQLALRDPLRYMGYPAANTIPATRLWRGQPYVNVAIFQILYKPFPDALVPADAVRYFPNGDVGYRNDAPYPRSRLSLRLLGSLLFHFLRDPLTWSPLNYARWNAFARAHAARLDTLTRQLEAARSPADVLTVLDGAYALDAQFLSIHRWSLTYADVTYKILARWAGNRAQLLVSDVPNLTRTVNAELELLARAKPPLDAALLARIRAHEPLTAAEQQTAGALAAFLRRHGHRSFGLDLALPTFREDPTQLLALLPADHSRTPARLPASFLQARADAEQELAAWQRPLFRVLLGLARQYARLREDQRYAWQASLALTRRAFLALGADLTTQNLLETPNAIFYTTRQEIRRYYARDLSGAALAAQIATRQREWDEYRAASRARDAETYPLFLRGAVPVAFGETSKTARAEWRGRGVSAGLARGVARVVHDPRELGRVGAGEILVAPSTDPAWTPVFARLAGLVLERGGVLSHGAVVAREYHLPAVAAVTNLIGVIQDGDWIEIDGTRGIVRRVQKSSGLLRPAAQ